MEGENGISIGCYKYNGWESKNAIYISQMAEWNIKQEIRWLKAP